MGRLAAIQVNHASQRLWWWAGILPAALCVLTAGGAHGAGFRSPEECQAYTGEEHLTCLYEYIGIRDDKPATGALDKAEQEMTDQIREQRDQVDRMSSGTPPPRSPEPLTQASPPAAVPPSSSPAAPPAAAAAPSFLSPYECRAYAGDAHLNCLYAYIEIQRDKAAKVQDDLRAQRESLGQLREQVDRQQRLQEQAASSPPPVTTYVTPPLYPPLYPGFGYGYPGYGYLGLGYSTPGLSLFFGSPGLYYGRPFYGPRFFGQRFYGPRFYGPRSFGGRRR